MGEQIKLWYNNEQLEKIVALAGTTDKTEVTKFIKEKSLLDLTGTQNQLSHKENLDRLKELDLTIKCWKGLLEIRDQVPFKIDPMSILQGSQGLEAPKLMVSNNGTTSPDNFEPNKNKMSWIHYCPLFRKEREFSTDVKQCIDCNEVCN